MTDYRSQTTPPDQTTVHVKERRSSSAVLFILGAVVALLAVLWFAFSDPRPATDGSGPAVTIENNTAPEAAAPVAPATPEATVTPDTATPEVTTPAPEATPAPDATTPAPAAPAPVN